MGMLGGLYMLLDDLADEVTAGVQALLEVSEGLRTALEAVVDGVLLLVGGLLPELIPL